MSRINCRQCGTDTNECPPWLPSDWNGFCPRCAVGLSLEGELTKLTPEKFAEMLAGQLTGEALEVGVLIAVPVSGLAPYGGPQCLN